MGVLQGSVLGPLIFILFINVLPEYILATCTVIFSDDTSIADEDNTIKQKLNLISQWFTDWSHWNKLIVNEEKTIFMHFFGR